MTGSPLAEEVEAAPGELDRTKAVKEALERKVLNRITRKEVVVEAGQEGGRWC